MANAGREGGKVAPGAIANAGRLGMETRSNGAESIDA